MKQYPTKHKPHIPKQRATLTLARVDEIVGVLKSAFGNVVVNRSGSQPAVQARDHNRAWTKQHTMRARIEGRTRVILMNPNTRASVLQPKA